MRFFFLGVWGGGMDSLPKTVPIFPNPFFKIGICGLNNNNRQIGAFRKFQNSPHFVASLLPPLLHTPFLPLVFAMHIISQRKTKHNQHSHRHSIVERVTPQHNSSLACQMGPPHACAQTTTNCTPDLIASPNLGVSQQ